MARPMFRHQNESFSALWFHTRTSVSPTHTIDRQAKAEHAVNTEQRGMTMIGGRVQTLHEIERERRIDQEAENAGTDKIPEQHRRKEHEWPAIIGFPLRLSFDLGVVIGLESDYHKRHDLERGK